MIFTMLLRREKFSLLSIILFVVLKVCVSQEKCRLAPKNCPKSKYYSSDGSCNNLKNFWWGKSNTPYARYQPAKYDNGIDSPRTKSIYGYPLPNSRSVSLAVHYPKWTIEDYKIKFSHYATIFGQFFSFDLTRIDPGATRCLCDSNKAECFNIATPPNDEIDVGQKCMVFTRSMSSFPTFKCKFKQRQQLNTATHYLDLSQIYGSDQSASKTLRGNGGLLKSTKIPGFAGQYLSFAKLGSCKNDKPNKLCFVSGDPRVNENMILTSIFTVWMREHNRIVGVLEKLNPQWNSERLYQEARRILIAIYQKIIFEEYLPILIGTSKMRQYKLEKTRRGYFMDYNPRLHSQIRNEFSTSVGRFGHTLVQNWGLRADRNLMITGNVTFFNLLLQPPQAYTDGGLDSLCRGSIIDTSSGYDAHLTDAIQNRMFEDNSTKAETHRQSLSALNIQRGRDHGTPGYVTYRKFCKLSVPDSFDNIRDISKDTIRDMKNVYKKVEDVDLFTGLVSETPIKGAIVGPLAACLLGNQLYLLKHGDRLFYENGHDRRTRFSLNQIKEIRKMTMSKILCEHLKLDRVPRNVFLLPDTKTNPYISCKRLSSTNLNAFIEQE